MTDRPPPPPIDAPSNVVPFTLAGLAFACVIAVDSRGMAAAVVLCCVVWIVAMHRQWRAIWSGGGHRAVIAAAGGVLGVLGGLELMRSTAPFSERVSLVTGGWPVPVTVGRVANHPPEFVVQWGASVGWEGRWIEDHVACAANFAIWFAVTFALVFPLRRGSLTLLVIGARWLPPLALLAHYAFGEVLTAGPVD